MRKQMFEMDFTFLPQIDFTAPIGNVMDLTDRYAVRQLLGFSYGKEFGAGTSDYELFYELCKASAVLQGHPLPARLAFLLHAYFNTEDVLSLQTCKHIWQTVANQCMEQKITVADVAKKMTAAFLSRCVMQKKDLKLAEAVGTEPILDGNSLLFTAHQQWNGWSLEMREICDAFALAECHAVYLRLPKSFCFSEPNPYSVNGCLSDETADRKNNGLLLTQTARFLCKLCRERQWKLILRIDCGGDAATSLLAYLGRTVGLPAVVWSAASFETGDALLAFFAKEGLFDARYALLLADYPSDAELVYAISSRAARYPLGRIAMISGGQLLDQAFARARAERVLNQMLFS